MPTRIQDLCIASGSFNGALRDYSAIDLGAIAVKEALKRSQLTTNELVQELVMGNVLSAGLGQAPARGVCLKAGLSKNTVCTTVNKVCSSGLKAVTMAAQSIMLGFADIAVAGGMESMTRAPYYVDQMRFGRRMGDAAMVDGMIKDGLWDLEGNVHMGSIAEAQAKDSNIGREDMDRFTASSYSRAARALSNDSFRELVKVDDVLDYDEEIHKVKNLEKLPALKPAFEKDGNITAGNSSKLSDGAAAVFLASEVAVKEHGLAPQAKVLAFADAELAPAEFPIAPATAIPKALERAGISLKDVDLFEINEAFASVVIANYSLLQLNPERVNVYGGAVALGHPIGASGARILTTLLSALGASFTADVGVAAVCNGGGGSTAIVVTSDFSIS